VLPDGTTLELLAICTHPNASGRWWGPAGSPWEHAPYERLERALPLAGYEFLVGSDRTPDVDYQCDVSGATSLSACKPAGAKSYDSAYGLVYVAQMPETQDTAAIEIAVAVGEWKTNALYHSFSCSVAFGFAGGGVIFNPPQDIEGHACLVVSHTFDLLAARVVALGEDQKVHLASAENVTAVRGMEARRCVFDLPTAEIREVLFQTRPYARVKFEQISLREGRNTPARVVVDANEGPLSRAENPSPKDRTRKSALPVVDTSALTPRKRPAAGDKMPALKASTFDGGTLDLAQYRGKYVLLDFWATWCAPCLAEMPFLQDVYREFGSDARFVMISITLDRDVNAAKNYVSKFGIKWTQGFLAQAGDEAQYGVDTIPACFLLGPDGTILAKDLRGAQLTAAVADVLRHKP